MEATSRDLVNQAVVNQDQLERIISICNWICDQQRIGCVSASNQNQLLKSSGNCMGINIKKAYEEILIFNGGNLNIIVHQYIHPHPWPDETYSFFQTTAHQQQLINNGNSTSALPYFFNNINNSKNQNKTNHWDHTKNSITRGLLEIKDNYTHHKERNGKERTGIACKDSDEEFEFFNENQVGIGLTHDNLNCTSNAFVTILDQNIIGGVESLEFSIKIISN
ncbi:hypothetical protein ACTA71_010640 [Dictyostelium dimigraforme]